ncbi:MAG TPA: DMT family transporter [Nitrospira sp.]|nr:DMT family transporter [Nitrospira sp.]
MPRQADRGGSEPRPLSHVVPILCLIGVVALLSSITPAIKYTLQHGSVDVLGLACSRVLIGFVFLIGITAWVDLRGLRGLTAHDIWQLTLLGMLGVGAYGVAAWGLRYTTVTHYALIYSLLPTFTTLISICCGKDRINPMTTCGIVISWTGCLVAVTNGSLGQGLSFGFGDALALLFTLMMSCHIVLSPNIVKRFGVWTANTTMFGTTAVVLLAGEIARGTLPDGQVSWEVMGLLMFIGAATAGVFLLRSRALQSLTPATVGAYHNLIPFCTIGLAYVVLSESITIYTLLCAPAVLAGTELVRRGALCPNRRPHMLSSLIHKIERCYGGSKRAGDRGASSEV